MCLEKCNMAFSQGNYYFYLKWYTVFVFVDFSEESHPPDLKSMCVGRSFKHLQEQKIAIYC